MERKDAAERLKIVAATTSKSFGSSNIGKTGARKRKEKRRRYLSHPGKKTIPEKEKAIYGAVNIK